MMTKMHLDYTYEQASQIAKAKDVDGSLALKGMDLFIAEYNHCMTESVGCNEAISYLTNTYLECIDSTNFFTWVTQGNEDGKPMIISKEHFKEMFSEISEMNQSLQGMVDDIAILYNQEWWIFGYESYDIYLATTTYREDYTKINLLEVHQAMSYFSALIDIFKDDIKDNYMKKFIKIINKNTNCLLKNYKIEEMTPIELFDLVNEKLGLGYC